MEDLKLKHAIFEMRKNLLVSHIKNDDLKRVAAAYEDNMHQVESIIRGFLSMMSVVTRYEAAMVEACHMLTGKYRQVSGDEKDVELQKKLDEMLHAKVDVLEARMKADLDGARREDERLLNNINWVLATYGQNKSENEHIRHVRNMYKSMVVGAWTAFEVMAVDLWESAVNQHPKVLASITKPQSVKGEGDKKLDFSILEQYDYDLSKVMGTIHRSERRFNFRTLDGTRDAYNSSFRRDSLKVKTAINEQTLDALSQMRHVIVHNGSRVDERFKTEGGKIPVLLKWTSLPLDTPINLDGQEAVEVLIVPALKTAVRLIQAVDEWLTNNP